MSSTTKKEVLEKLAELIKEYRESVDQASASGMDKLSTGLKSNAEYLELLQDEINKVPFDTHAEAVAHLLSLLKLHSEEELADALRNLHQPTQPPATQPTPQPAQPTPQPQPQQPGKPQQPGTVAPANDNRPENIAREIEGKIAGSDKLTIEGKFDEARKILSSARQQAAGLADHSLLEKVDEKISRLREIKHAALNKAVGLFLNSCPYTSKDYTENLIAIFTASGNDEAEVARIGVNKDAIEALKKDVKTKIAVLLAMAEDDKDKVEEIKNKIIKRFDERESELYDILIKNANADARNRIFVQNHLPANDAEKRVYAYKFIETDLKGIKQSIANDDLPKIKN